MTPTLFLLLTGLSLNGQNLAPTRVGVGAAQTRLTLEEAAQMALKNNLEIEIEKTSQASAREAVKGARGFLDPLFQFQPSAESRDTPTGSVLASATGKISESFVGQNFRFRQRLPWQGASFRADFENLRQSTNNPFVSLNPFLTPRLTFGVSMPLWRDRLLDRERSELLIRRKQVDVSDVDFELRVIDVIARVELAYYDLVGAREDVAVSEESVKLAQEQLERTRRMIEAGSVAPVELAAAEAELERRKDTYFTMLGQVTAAENNLKQLLAGGRDHEIWKDEIIPTSTARSDGPKGYELPDMVRTAVGKRAELRAIDLRKLVNDQQRDQAVNQTKPAVNLTAGYASSGLAGTLLTTDNPFSGFQTLVAQRVNELSQSAGLPALNTPSFGGVPTAFVGGYGQSLANLFGAKYSTFQAGLSFDLTLRNQAAHSAVAQTAIAERRLALDRKRAEQIIEAQVRNALQSIETARQRTAAAEASARAAKEKLDSETRLFQTGESTNFLVLTRQNELADSRRRVVAATQEFNKSVARLALALGSTLESYQMRLR
ncbi:MAG: TolC family protein [Bryobacteraceae bacterium]|nr:TolC family protein [Bryobacteraceae bacterium]